MLRNVLNADAVCVLARKVGITNAPRVKLNASLCQLALAQCCRCRCAATSFGPPSVKTSLELDRTARGLLPAPTCGAGAVRAKLVSLGVHPPESGTLLVSHAIIHSEILNRRAIVPQRLGPLG